MRNVVIECFINIDSRYDIRLLQIKVELSEPLLPVNNKHLSRSQFSGVLVRRSFSCFSI